VINEGQESQSGAGRHAIFTRKWAGRWAIPIYTKNPEIITENGDLIRDLAKDIRKENNYQI